MAFLAALALAGWVGAASLAQHWQQGAGSALTVQVPQPQEPAAQGGGTRLERVLALLVATPGVASARALSDDELGELLRPWLGSDAERLAVPLPAVIAVRLAEARSGSGPAGAAAGRGGAGHAGRKPRCVDPPARRAGSQPAGLRRAGAAAGRRGGRSGNCGRDAGGTRGAARGYRDRAWARRHRRLHRRSLCRSRDAARNNRWHRRRGACPAGPADAGESRRPFAGATSEAMSPADIVAACPAALWLTLPGLPAAAAAIGFLTAQATVRRWLRRLP